MSVWTALIGFASAFFNVRLIAPLTAGIAMAATIGAGATAQIGAMRSTKRSTHSRSWESARWRTWHRLAFAAGVVVVVPVYCVAVHGFLLRRPFWHDFFYGQSTGVYDHYFYTFCPLRTCCGLSVLALRHGW
jgi:phospholipid/cholesterol/gamma-HCH transport system permease protein